MREELQFNYAFKFRRRWTSKFFERCWSCNGHTPRLFLLRTRFQEAASVPLSLGGGGDKIAEILLVRVRDIAVKSAYSPLFDRHYCSPSKILHHRFLRHHPSIVDFCSNLAANLIASPPSADYAKETIEKRRGESIFFPFLAPRSIGLGLHDKSTNSLKSALFRATVSMASFLDRSTFPLSLHLPRILFIVILPLSSYSSWNQVRGNGSKRISSRR